MLSVHLKSGALIRVQRRAHRANHRHAVQPDIQSAFSNKSLNVVCQGDCLSPTLFRATLSGIMSKLKQQKISFCFKSSDGKEEQPGQDDSDTDRSDNVTPKQKYELKRKRNFVPSWSKEFPWVECEDDIMFCSACRQYADLADPNSSLVVGIKGAKRKEVLVSHARSWQHNKVIKKQEVDKVGAGV